MNPNIEHTYQEIVLEIVGKYKVQENFHQKTVILLFWWKYCAFTFVSWVECCV